MKARENFSFGAAITIVEGKEGGVKAENARVDLHITWVR
jgi:hypothetical protein